MAVTKCQVLLLIAALNALPANSDEELIIVPSSEDVFETVQGLVLPMTLECPYNRHKYIVIHGVTLLNGSNILLASSLAPNIEQQANTECQTSLVQADASPARCNVSLNGLPQDGSIDGMNKVVTFDCRTSVGDPSTTEKTISKAKGTIYLKCDSKEAVPEITAISLASGRSVSVLSANWDCSLENIGNIIAGKGGQCQIKRDGYLNDSEMTVTYKCSEPPKRQIDEFKMNHGRDGAHGRENIENGN